MSKNIILIDKRVQNYELIVSAIDPALATGIAFDYYEDTIDTLKTQIDALGIDNTSSGISVGLVQHNYKTFMFNMLASENLAPVVQVAEKDPELLEWSRFKDFIMWLNANYGASYFDMMACALYSDHDWKYIIDTLTVQTGVTIRASTDDTGAASLGGDWFLESHTGVNLKTVYFMEVIEEYKDILTIRFNGLNNYMVQEYTKQIPTITGPPSRPTRPTRPSAPPNLPSLPSPLTIPTNSSSGRVIQWGNPIGVTFSDVSANLASNIIHIEGHLPHAQYAINSNGGLFRWGLLPGLTIQQFNTIFPSNSDLSSGVVSVISKSYQNVAYALKTDGSIVGWGNITTARPSSLSSGVVFASVSNWGLICLKSDGSLRGWGGNFSSSDGSPSVPIYPSGANVNSGVVKFDASEGGCIALKNDGSVAFLGYSGSSVLVNPTTFYPAGSNITSGVVDVVVSNFNFVALKGDGTVVVWGSNASNYQTSLNGIYAVKLIKPNLEFIFVLRGSGSVVHISDFARPPNAAGLLTDVVDLIQGGGGYLLLNSDGRLGAYTGESISYFHGVDISVFTDVVKIDSINHPWNTFNVGAVVIKSNGELRTLGGNTLISTNVNDIATRTSQSSSQTAIYIKSDGSAGHLSTNFGYTFTSNELDASSGQVLSAAVLPGGWLSMILKANVQVASTIASSTFSVASTKTFGDVSFAITTRPTSNSTGVITYSSSNTNVATIDPSGNFITLVGAGDVSFNAIQAATSQYTSATNTSNTLTVARGTSTLSASSFAVPSSKTFGNAPFSFDTLPTSNNSSVAIVYSSSNTNVATVDASGTTITLVGAGDVSFNATQPQTNQYNAATKTSNTLTVARGTSTLSASSFAVPSSKTFGNSPFSFDTLPTSNNTSVAIVYSSSNTNVATVDASGTTITLVGAGDVSFNATQPQTNQYNAATKTSNTLTVTKATTTLAFVNPPTSKNVTDALFTVNASSASTGAVTYSSSNVSIATVNASTGLVTLKAAGSVTITASQASSANYQAPADATCSIVIASAGTALQGQTISSSTSFASVDLSGASLAGTTVAGVSFSDANLRNVNFSGAVITNANFSNTNIKGATNLPAFSTVQKLQLLKNINNADISAVQVTAPVSGSDINALLATPISEVAAATFTIKAPTTVDASANKLVTVNASDVSGNKSIYIPINANETVKINNAVYSFDGTNLVNPETGSSVLYLSIEGKPFKIYAGSVVALNVQDALNKITINGDGLYNVLYNILVPRTI